MVAVSAVASSTELISRYRAIRARTRSLFTIPIDDAYFDRPIPLRNPIVFYDGHLPAFAINTLIKLARREKGIDSNFETLFARGIDPADASAVRDDPGLWPSRDEVAAYGREAERLIERALADLDDNDPVQREAAANILEHELMHQETFVYLLHAMGYERKLSPGSSRAEGEGSTEQTALNGPQRAVKIEAGIAILGNDGSSFGWDNEFPQHRVRVEAFEIDRFNVTNGEYLEYMRATGADAPHFWARRTGEWFWRSMFDLIPLPLDWPVYATHDEATAYAKWKGARLMTEAEWHRAVEGLDWRSLRGNFDFTRWEPQPVGQANASAHGVYDLVGNGWEWTSTAFAGFAGFEPMNTYPQYSADFFDGQHFVLKGASPATARDSVRPSFRNWFRPNYPYVYATFRCVR